MQFALPLLFVFLGLATAGEPTREARQLAYPQQPDGAENLWDHIDVQKLEQQLDSWHGVSTLPTASAVANSNIVPKPARQFYPGVPGDNGEIPRPILPPTFPPEQPLPIPPDGCLDFRGQYPSQKSCANYLNCWDDVVIEQQCPNGLLFNDVTGLCDFDYNVNCGIRQAPTPKPSLPAGSRLCPDLNGRYRSSSNCSEFYVCLTGRPIKFSCPRGLVYNDELSVCDYPYRVDCQGASTPTPLPPATAPPVTYPPVSSEQPQQPQPTYPPSSYPGNPWLGRTESDPWHQRPVASQIELDKQQQQQNQQADALSQAQQNQSQSSSISNPWNLVQAIPAEMTKVPCENGNVHRLTESCSSVVVCRQRRPQLVQCPSGQIYDRPSDSCRYFTIAKC